MVIVLRMMLCSYTTKYTMKIMKCNYVPQYTAKPTTKPILSKLQSDVTQKYKVYYVCTRI